MLACVSFISSREARGEGPHNRLAWAAAGGGADTKGAAGGVGAAADAEDSSERISSRGITSLFIFCLVWTLGGSIDEASRAAFDEFVRKHVDPEGSIVPTHGTLRLPLMTSDCL